MGMQDRVAAEIVHRGLARVNADIKIVRSVVANCLSVGSQDSPIPWRGRADDQLDAKCVAKIDLDLEIGN
jgi:hypothetical protein